MVASVRVVGALALALCLPVAALADGPTQIPTGPGIPEHPRDLRYPPLAFEPPRREDHRLVLANGLRVYLVADRAVPTIQVRAWIDAGEVDVPREKRGLARLTGGLLRSGGIEGLETRALDARLDALAIEMEAGFDLEAGHASLWTRTACVDEALLHFAAMLRRPAFAEDRVRREKDDLQDEVAHRDDEPSGQLDRKVAEVVFGDHPLAWQETTSSVGALTRDDVVAFHRAHVVPGNVLLAVSGDFDRADMAKRLEALFGDWKGEATARKRTAPSPEPRPGVFLLDREVNQGFVEIAQQGIAIGDPDEIPLQVMNFILGGGSFTSRITARVRSDEGLAYSAGSTMSPGRGHVGTVSVYFQSKAESTAFAAKICAEELRRIRSELVKPEELARAKASLKDRFPERFSTAASAAVALAESEWNARPASYHAEYRERVEKVTAEDVLRVAKARLDPARMSFVAIGPRAVLEARDEAHAAAIADWGPVKILAAESEPPARPERK